MNKKPGSSGKSSKKSLEITNKKHPPITPDILKEYEKVLPGAAERIFNLIEKRETHEQEMEKKHLDYSHTVIMRGQLFALIVAIIALLIGCITALKGAPISGTFIGTGGVVGLVSVFIYGSRKKTKK